MRRKVGAGKEKPNKNAHISTVNIGVIITLEHNFTLFLPSLFRTKQPSIVPVIIFMLAIKIHRKYVPNASETNISLTSHRIFADFSVKTMQ